MVRTKIIIIIIVIAILGGGAYLALHKAPAKTPATQSNQTQTSADTITFDGSAFSPATLTVTSGTMVSVKNTSSEDLQFDSDPHPVHTDDTDLNVGTVPAGQSKSFTATKTGNFGYHDHLDPSIQGKITIR